MVGEKSERDNFCYGNVPFNSLESKQRNLKWIDFIAKLHLRVDDEAVPVSKLENVTSFMYPKNC